MSREQLLRRVALTVLNQRLTDRAMKPGSPYVGAQAASVPSLLRSGSITQLGLSASPEKWRQALEAVSEEQRMCRTKACSPGIAAWYPLRLSMITVRA